MIASFSRKIHVILPRNQGKSYFTENENILTKNSPTFKFQAEPFRFGILSTNFDFCESLWIQKKLAQ